MQNSAYVYNIPQIPESHKHRYAQLVFGFTGTSMIEIDGDSIHLDRQKGCIIPSQEYHRYFSTSENTSIAININQPILNDALKRLLDAPRFFTIDQNMHKFIQFASMELPRYKGSANIGQDQFSQNIVNVFKELLISRIVKKADLPPTIDLELIDHYIEERIHEKISVKDLAKQVHTSPSHFYSLFRKETSISPHQFIIKKRVEKAIKLLQTTEMSIVEISNETGFSSQSALNNTLKSQLGMTPGRIRHG